MSRTRSPHVADVKQQLIARIADVHHSPGQRFLSNRAVARRYGISYQTADILLRELVQEGVLVRRAASGTYIPGERAEQAGVLLIFHPRARHKNSFGSFLLDQVTARLDRERIDWRMSWKTPAATAASSRALGVSRYPIIWERPEAVDLAIRLKRPALVLNARPPAGVGATLIDSVSVDDFSGGAYAAQHLMARHSSGSSSSAGSSSSSGSSANGGAKRSRRKAFAFAVLAGPAHDQRSAARVAGFLSVAPATVINSTTWFYEDALAVADRALAAGRDGIFCCNDRLAQAIVRRATDRARPRPHVVGFDDAPIARWLNLTTIAIPWEELVDAVIGAIRRKQASPASAAIAQLVSTRIVLRG
jgi:DNA-binding transcriptional regulator YhcF (GntR family)